MKICIAGKNQIAVDCLSYLINELDIDRQSIVVCFNKSDNGIDSFQPSFKNFCQQQNLLYTTLEELYDIQDLIFISLEFDRLIPVKRMRSNKLYNIHFSLLPKYRGMYTSAWPLLNGEQTSGVSLHYIDDGIDTGDLIAQKSFEIKDSYTCRDLYFKYLEQGTLLFKANIQQLLAGSYVAEPQSFSMASYYSKESIDFNNVVIDLSKCACEIRNQLRAYSFPEFQMPKINNQTIEKAEILNTKSIAKPGTIIFTAENFFDLATIDFDLRCFIKV